MKPRSDFTWNGLGVHGDNILEGIAADAAQEEAKATAGLVARTVNAYALSPSDVQDRYALAIEVMLKLAAQLNPASWRALDAHARKTFRALVWGALDEADE